MSQLFISHSNVDEAEALAVRDWLVNKGWDDIFLDLDPERGLVAGQRWQDELQKAVKRCEAVLFLVSTNWINSRWCIHELKFAESLNKQIFGIIVDKTSIKDIPVEMTANWQMVDLSRKGPSTEFDVKSVSGRGARKVQFNSNELIRLKSGLIKAGLDAKYFAWPPHNDPDRAPYRGLRALQREDAGIFFGRDGQIVEALDSLRGLRDKPFPRMLVILGASGAGKSSFMRAGLLPRLGRDDRHFVVLETIRPERAVISGDTGVIASLEACMRSYGLSPARASIRKAIEAVSSKQDYKPIKAMLKELLTAASANFDKGTKAPTIVIPIDQAEELYFSEGIEEAQLLSKLLGELTSEDDPAVIAIVTIRSDAYEHLQLDPVLGALDHKYLNLPPMPQGSYSEVILGPVRRLSMSENKLVVEDRLVAELLKDIDEGGAKDALPLLAFTLERLYSEYGGRLTVKDYDEFGRISGSIEVAVEGALTHASQDPHIPKERDQQLSLLRRGLIPWLAGVDPDTKETRRKVARLSDIPEEARPLMELLVEQRLLSTDSRVVEGATGKSKNKTEITIEPAHEALLRQWGLLEGWLEEDFEALSAIEGVQRAALEWDANDKTDDWLAHSAGRLETAEAFSTRQDLGDHLTPDQKAYLASCRKADNEQRNKELEAQKKIAKRTTLGLIAASILTIIAGTMAMWGWLEYTESNQLAEELGDKNIELAANQDQLNTQINIANEQKEIAEKAASDIQRLLDYKTALDAEGLLDNGQVELALQTMMTATKNFVGTNTKDDLLIAFDRALEQANQRIDYDIPVDSVGFELNNILYFYVESKAAVYRFDGSGPPIKISSIKGKFNNIYDVGAEIGPVISFKMGSELYFYAFDQETGVGKQLLKFGAPDENIVNWDIEYSLDGVVLARKDILRANPESLHQYFLGSIATGMKAVLRSQNSIYLQTGEDGKSLLFVGDDIEKSLIYNFGIKTADENDWTPYALDSGCMGPSKKNVNIEALKNIFKWVRGHGWVIDCELAKPYLAIMTNLGTSAGDEQKLFIINYLSGGLTNDDELDVKEFRVQTEKSNIDGMSLFSIPEHETGLFAYYSFRDLNLQSLGYVSDNLFDQKFRFPTDIELAVTLGKTTFAVVLAPNSPDSVTKKIVLTNPAQHYAKTSWFLNSDDFENNLSSEGLNYYDIDGIEECFVGDNSELRMKIHKSDRNYLATTNPNIVNVVKNGLKTTIKVMKDIVQKESCIKISPNENYYYTREGNIVSVFDAASGDMIGEQIFNGALYQVAFADRDSADILASVDTTVIHWQHKGNTTWENKILFKSEDPIQKVLLSPKKNRLLVHSLIGSGNVESILYSIESNRKWKKIGTAYKRYNAGFTNNGDVYYSVGAGGVQLFHLHSLEEARQEARRILNPI